MAVNDHQDIIDLAAAGDVAEAEALLAERQATGGVSGQDVQTCEAAIAAAKEAAKTKRPSRN